MFWGTLMEQVIGALKNEKISALFIGLFMLGGWQAYLWAAEQHKELDTNSLSRHQQNQELMVSKKEFQDLEFKVDRGFERRDISDANQEIRDIKLSLQIAEATNADPDDIAHIEDELQHVIAYKHCLVNRQPNCEFLREVE